MSINNPLVGTWISNNTSIDSDPVLSLEVQQEGASDSACAAIAHVLLRSETHEDVRVDVDLIWLNKPNEVRDQFFFYGKGLDGSGNNQTLVAFAGWGSVNTNPNLMTINGGVADCTQPLGGTVATPGTRDFNGVFRRKEGSNSGSTPPPPPPPPSTIFPLAGTYTYLYGVYQTPYRVVITNAGPNRVTIDLTSFNPALIWSADIVSSTQLLIHLNGGGTASATLSANPSTINVAQSIPVQGGVPAMVWTKNS